MIDDYVELAGDGIIQRLKYGLFRDCTGDMKARPKVVIIAAQRSFTRPYKITGQPAGLRVGLQIVGRLFYDP